MCYIHYIFQKPRRDFEWLQNVRWICAVVWLLDNVYPYQNITWDSINVHHFDVFALRKVKTMM